MSPEGPANLLIFRIGSIGDTVVALPCFHAIARAFPDHHKILLTNAVAGVRATSVEAVLEGTGLIDQAVYFPLGRGKLAYSIALVRQLRQLNAQTLIYLAPRPTALPVYRDVLYFKAAGIRTIVGAPYSERSRECHVDRATGELEYEAERLARSLGPAIPVDLSAPNWDLRLSATELATAASRLWRVARGQPIVALSPGARIPAKDWGEDHWSALIRLLQQRTPKVVLVFVGAPDERSLSERLAQLWPGPKVVLCGDLTPRESAAVLGRCDLMVCHDSGPMHLAAAQGTRCVALFGNYNAPRQWFPFGREHRVIYEPRGVRCIGVERVADAVEASLRELRAAITPETRQSASAASR